MDHSKPAADVFQDKALSSRFRYELWRLPTFVNFPPDAPHSPLLLARQGFIYIGGTERNGGTSIMCVFCSLVLRNLYTDVNVEETHRTLKPNCAIWTVELFWNIPFMPCDEDNAQHFTQLNSHQNIDPSLSSTSEVRSYEAQVFPLEVDTPQKAVAPATPLNHDHVQNPDATHSHQTTNNTNLRPSSNTVHSQATDSNHASAHVTNRAQTLSFPGQGAHSSTNSFAQAASSQARPDSQPVYSQHTIQNNGNNEGSNHRDGHKPISGHDQRYGHDPNPGHDALSGHDQRYGHDPNPGHDALSGHDQVDGHDPSAGHSQQGGPRGTVSYEDIGILTSRPKRPEYALERTRLQSFEFWPSDYHIRPGDLVKAGFFYTGHGDCARCFYCGGGLRNWELGDDVWVEHARWFYKCSFLKQTVGNAFIDTVQKLWKEKEIITCEDVIQEMIASGLENMIPEALKKDQTTSELEKDIAVRLLIDHGFKHDDVIQAALKVKAKGNSTAVDLIYEEIPDHLKGNLKSTLNNSNASERVSRGKEDAGNDHETMKSLQDLRSELRDLSLCKVCLDKEVSVVFLPCGHFVSCTDCTFALTVCPVCRVDIQGVIHASVVS